MNQIYNISKLIKQLKKIEKEYGNCEIYIKDTYSTDEYLRISDLRVDQDKDVIIEINLN